MITITPDFPIVVLFDDDEAEVLDLFSTSEGFREQHLYLLEELIHDNVDDDEDQVRWLRPFFDFSVARTPDDLVSVYNSFDCGSIAKVITQEEYDTYLKECY